MTAEIDLGITAGLSAQLGEVAAAVNREAARSRSRAARIQDGIRYIPVPVITFTALSASGGAIQYGPNTGWVWAVQRISISGFGATTDFVNVYRGHSSSDATAEQNYLQTFTAASASNLRSTAWHPGGKGLILLSDETLVLNGTFTGTLGYVSSDVIQVRADCLADYLI